MSQTTKTPTKTPTDIQEYLLKLFDGVFTVDQIDNRRKLVFARIAGYVSPKSGAKVSDLLTDDQIGEVINALSDAYFNRAMQAKAKRIGEGGF